MRSGTRISSSPISRRVLERWGECLMPMKKRSEPEDMPGAKDVTSVNKTRSFAIYGRSGSGKTTLASTFPGDVLVLDIKDEGTDSVADVKGLQYREIETLDDFDDAFWWLQKNPDRYGTVVIDTVTQLQHMILKETVGGKSGKSAGDWGSMTQKEWGKVTGQLKDFITDFRDLTKLGMQVVFLIQERTFNANEDDKTLDEQISPEVGPAVSPAVRTHLNACVSVIAHTHIFSKWVQKEDPRTKKKKDVERLEFRLHLGPNSLYDSKVRKPRGIVAPSYIVDPTYEDILEVITGKA